MVCQICFQIVENLFALGVEEIESLFLVAGDLVHWDLHQLEISAKINSESFSPPKI